MHKNLLVGKSSSANIALHIVYAMQGTCKTTFSQGDTNEAFTTC